MDEKTMVNDILGNVTKQDRSGGRITTYEYDNVGNLVKSTNALGNSKLYSRILSWRIPWTEDPGRLQPIGLQRVGHD